MRINRQWERKAEARRGDAAIARRLAEATQALTDSELLEAVEEGGALPDGPIARSMNLSALSDGELLGRLDALRRDDDVAVPVLLTGEDPVLAAELAKDKSQGVAQ